ncbi:MAG TPA: histidine--tRNA ligase [Candidatus Bathyarchaeota archaeon]|nr:histidine--tRNA ligase [Candidatus Bathyarchaeota archaeon]
MFKTVRGMRDLMPVDAERMRHVEQVSREVSKLYGYEEIITPILESYDLLAAKTSEEIRERMYTFKDLGSRKVAMRPEFTASVARLVASKLRNEPKPMRLFSVGSLYRYDEPQYGRFREFWQSNYELFGSDRPEADAEILMLTNDLLKRLGLKNYRFKIGHTGILKGILDQEEMGEAKQNSVRQLLDKKSWEDALAVARDADVSQKCLAALERLFETRGEDAFKVLETVKETVSGYDGAVAAADNLWKILELVKDSGVKLEITVEAGFARGLEYYTGMIFESYVPALDVALGGGGRYDRLIQLFGGEPIPAVGVAQGIDRIVLALKKQKVSPKSGKEKSVVVISVKDESMGKALELSDMLRKSGLAVEVAVMGRSVSRALADADRRGVAYAVIVGPKELEEKKVVLKDMDKGEQKTVLISDLTEAIFSGSK